MEGNKNKQMENCISLRKTTDNTSVVTYQISNWNTDNTSERYLKFRSDKAVQDRLLMVRRRDKEKASIFINFLEFV